MRRNIPLYLALAALVACGSDSSTEPSVFNINPGTPTFWSLVGFATPSYTLGIDHKTVHSGGGALAIVSIDSSPQLFRGVGQFILADQYRGKRVRLSGWVRHVNLVASDAGLWMRVDGNFTTLSFDNFSTRSLKGTSDWHEIEVILDVPTDAIGIAFGVLLSGRGELLADDLALQVVPATGPTTNLLTGPTSTTFDAATFYSTNVGPRSIANMGFESQ